MLWRMGGWEYLKHFVQRKRTLVLESCLWARCLDLCTFLLPYMFSALRIPDVCCVAGRFVVFRNWGGYR